MGQLVGCVRGIAAACTALDFPVVSGNVSLYNETNGRAILPTPTIGGVGVLDDFTKSASLAFKNEGDVILLIGETQGWLGQSMYLREVCGREEGAPPPVDLAVEKRHGEFVRKLIADGRVTAVHDLSDGGLAGRAGRNGDGVGPWCRRSTRRTASRAHAFWFGEDQARYVVTATPGQTSGGGRSRAGVPVSQSRASERSAASHLPSAARRRSPSPISRRASNPGCRITWPARVEA